MLHSLWRVSGDARLISSSRIHSPDRRALTKAPSTNANAKLFSTCLSCLENWRTLLENSAHCILTELDLTIFFRFNIRSSLFAASERPRLPDNNLPTALFSHSVAVEGLPVLEVSVSCSKVSLNISALLLIARLNP